MYTRKQLHAITRDLNPEGLAQLALWVEACRRALNGQQIARVASPLPLRSGAPTQDYVVQVPSDIYGPWDGYGAHTYALNGTTIRCATTGDAWVALPGPVFVPTTEGAPNLKTFLPGKAADVSGLHELKFAVQGVRDRRDFIVCFSRGQAPLLDMQVEP